MQLASLVLQVAFPVKHRLLVILTAKLIAWSAIRRLTLKTLSAIALLTISTQKTMPSAMLITDFTRDLKDR